MKLLKILLLLLFVFVCSSCFAQYELLQINLEIQTLKEENNHIRFSLYQEHPDTFFLGIKRNPALNFKDYTTWLKRDADTIIIISKDNFNKIAELSLRLSNLSIISGMCKTDYILINNDNVAVNFEISEPYSKISYNIWNPNYNTKERNLDTFVDICKKILLLAESDYKIFFR